MSALPITPGPWKVQPLDKMHGGYEIVGASFRMVFFTIATDVTHEQGQQKMRDATAIAAVPNMVKALQLVHQNAFAGDSYEVNGQRGAFLDLATVQAMDEALRMVGAL